MDVDLPEELLAWLVEPAEVRIDEVRRVRASLERGERPTGAEVADAILRPEPPPERGTPPYRGAA